MKKFKTRKRIKFFKYILLILIVFFSYYFTTNILNNKKVDPKTYIKNLLNNSFNNQLNKKDNKSNNINPISLFEYNLSLKSNISSNKEFQRQSIEYIEQVNKEMSEPLIYIYNTHESEEYKIDYRYEYSIIPNVKIASYILQEKLENLGLNSIVETTSIKDILNQNNWVYRYSYKASRILLEKVMNEKPSIKYFIDIHRDSSKYDKTMIDYDNKKYARVLFVVGLEHENYQYNLDFSNKLNEMIEKKVPGISRGISKKEGLGVNGIYNQDLSKYCILIEIGGVENNIQEVSNTINIIGEVLKEYIENEK